MIVKRFVCDRCSKDIEGDNVFTIAIEEKPKDKLDDLGEFEDSLVDAHFCLDCKNLILGYIRNELEEKREIEPIVDDLEPEELKVSYEEPAAIDYLSIKPEVKQEKKPRAKRDLDTKAAAIELFRNGKSVGEIAKSFDLNYHTVYGWCHE